jgi:hypothetical protein
MRQAPQELKQFLWSEMPTTQEEFETAFRTATLSGDTQATSTLAQEWMRLRSVEQSVRTLSDQDLETMLRKADVANDSQVARIMAIEWRRRRDEKKFYKSLAESMTVPPVEPVKIVQTGEFWFLIAIAMIAFVTWKFGAGLKRGVGKEGLFSTVVHLCFMLFCISILLWTVQQKPIIWLVSGLLVGFGFWFSDKTIASARWLRVPSMIMLVISGVLILASVLKLLPNSPYESAQDYYEDRR